MTLTIHSFLPHYFANGLLHFHGPLDAYWLRSHLLGQLSQLGIHFGTVILIIV